MSPNSSVNVDPNPRAAAPAGAPGTTIATIAPVPSTPLRSGFLPPTHGSRLSLQVDALPPDALAGLVNLARSIEQPTTSLGEAIAILQTRHRLTELIPVVRVVGGGTLVSAGALALGWWSAKPELLLAGVFVVVAVVAGSAAWMAASTRRFQVEPLDSSRTSKSLLAGYYLLEVEKNVKAAGKAFSQAATDAGDPYTLVRAGFGMVRCAASAPVMGATLTALEKLNGVFDREPVWNKASRVALALTVADALDLLLRKFDSALEGKESEEATSELFTLRGVRLLQALAIRGLPFSAKHEELVLGVLERLETLAGRGTPELSAEVQLVRSEIFGPERCYTETSDEKPQGSS